jgi:hypothetical protein
MNTIIIDKENALDWFQKLMKLVLSWKKLEVKIKESKKTDIKASYENALKEYEKGEFTTLLEVK